MQLAVVPRDDPDRTIAFLQPALTELDFVDPTTVPANVSISNLRDTAVSLLAKAEAKSKDKGGGCLL